MSRPQNPQNLFFSYAHTYPEEAKNEQFNEKHFLNDIQKWLKYTVIYRLYRFDKMRETGIFLHIFFGIYFTNLVKVSKFLKL